jgi:hypothetical protein
MANLQQENHRPYWLNTYWHLSGQPREAEREAVGADLQHFISTPARTDGKTGWMARSAHPNASARSMISYAMAFRF